MGIIGLEKFTEELKANKPTLFKNEHIKNLKLVIDGNQLPYLLFSLLKSGHYGGCYDQLYRCAREFLGALRPQIEAIIFDGSRKTKKMEERIRDRIHELANLRNLKTKGPKLDSNAHLERMRDKPALMTRLVLVEVINELGIKYLMTEDMLDYKLAVYANNTRSTVLSKDSYYYVYNLSEGYVSIKHLMDALGGDLSRLSCETVVPVFRMKSLLDVVGLKSAKTWLYFCMLLGDYDKRLLRNSNCFSREIKWGASDSLLSFLNFLKKKEQNLMRNEYEQIVRSYAINFKEALNSKIDMFEFKLKLDDAMFWNQTEEVNDFDRFRAALLAYKTIYISVLVEDPSEESVFQCTHFNKILDYFYSQTFQHQKTEIDEYIREKNPNEENCLRKVVVEIDCGIKNNRIVEHLKQIDDLNLGQFSTSLCVWLQWLRNNKYSNELKLSGCQDQKKCADLFLEAILTNFMAIQVKKHLAGDIKCHLKCVDLKNGVQTQKLVEITNEYDRLLENIGHDSLQFFENDIKIVHRLNEFQAIYFCVGLVCHFEPELKNLKLLSPSNFLNGWFVNEFVIDSNGGVRIKFRELIKSVEPLQIWMASLVEQINKQERNIYYEKCENSDLLCSGFDALSLESKPNRLETRN